MEYTPIGLKNTYLFLDGNIIDVIGSQVEHLKLEYKCFQKRDEGNLLIHSLTYFTKTVIERLGYKISQTVISPLHTKTSAILILSAHKNSKQMRFF